MNFEILRKIGFTENEIKIYLDLLKSGDSTAYDIGKRIGIYRVHVYDKLEQLQDKGFVTYIYQGAKKHFKATSPEKIQHYLEEKKRKLEQEEQEFTNVLPELLSLTKLPKDDTFIEIFKGNEGLKYFLKNIIKTRKEVLIMGIDDQKYQQTLPVFMKQYFRDLKHYHIKERVITLQKKDIFLFDKKTASTTQYRFLASRDFNPTNTFIYGDNVVIVIWGTPVSAVMIKNKQVAVTYKNHFEHLWKIAHH